MRSEFRGTQVPSGERPPAGAAAPAARSLAGAIDSRGERPQVTAAGQRLARPLLVLALLAATHFLVDVVAATVNPLWPALEQQVAGGKGILWIYVSWTIATSFSQLIFGACADRLSLRWLIWAGPAMAVLCLSCLGWATNSVALAGLFILGGLGIAAFHPEAAAMAGSLLPEQRSRAMAIFALSGYLGQSLGPTYSGLVTDRLGLTGLTWGLLWGGAILALLTISLYRASPGRSWSNQTVSTRGGSISVRVLAQLLAIGSLRIIPALGVPFTLAFLLEADGVAGAVIGGVQSAFMAGIGIGAMACAAFIRRDLERATIWLLPLCAAPVLMSLPFVDGWLMVALVGLSGLLLGVTMPIYISYGQQLIPTSPRVASSITMGVSWGVAGGVLAGSFYLFRSADALPWIFLFFASTCLLSSLLCRWLPRPEKPY